MTSEGNVSAIYQSVIIDRAISIVALQWAVAWAAKLMNATAAEVRNFISGD